VEHTISKPAGRRIGWTCSCGKRFTTELQAESHIIDMAEKLFLGGEAEVVVEEPVIIEETSVEEDKPETKVVAKVETKQLLPIQKVQADIIKFGRDKVGDERAKEFAIHAALVARANPKIMNVINKNPDSFFTAYMASLSLDLMPNTVEREASLIPYGDSIQFIPEYRGLIKAARRSGEILTLNAELVFEGEEFEVSLGSDRKLIHKPKLEQDRTQYDKMIYAYATAKLTNGETVFAAMSRGEIDKIQRTVKTQSTDTPWKAWPERMAIKTVIKRLTQILPKSNDDSLARAVAYDNLSESGKLRFDRESGEIIEGELVEVRQSAIDAIQAATTKEEIAEVLADLPVEERKKAAALANKRIKEL
jgi:recombination protein RecT